MTRQRILDASEKLFSERGYSGTSLRAIADDAGVNLAAANYHFGSKEHLLEASFQRCMGPINDERIRRLDQLEFEGGSLSVQAVVRAFVEPALRVASERRVPRLAARIFVEPKDVSIPLLRRTHASTARRYLAALAGTVPEVDPDELRWRFHFFVGCLVWLTNFEGPLDLFDPGQPTGTGPAEAGREQLIAFAVAGISQGGIA